MLLLLASSGLTESFLVGNKLLRYFSALLLLTAEPDRNFLINASKSVRSDIFKNFTTTDTPQFRNFSRETMEQLAIQMTDYYDYL